MNHDKTQFCTGQEELVHRFLDGELSAAEHEEFTRHLSSCRACQEMLAEMEALFSSLTAWQDEPAPPRIIPMVMAHLPSTPAASPYPNWGGLALVSQIIIGVGFLLLAQSLLAPTLASPQVWQAWFAVTEIGFSLNSWGLEIWDQITVWFREIVLSPATPSGVSLSIGVSLTLILGLGVAWLVGNIILLRSPATTFKNGGAL